jgi:hypothetical protein
MEAPKKESVVLTLINILISALLSALGSFVNIPLGVIAGLTVVFICIAILGAVSGTILALKDFKRFWLLALVFSVTAVAALIYYSYLLGLGGLSPFQIYLAGFLFFYIFFVLFFLFTYLEKLIKSSLTPKP